MSGVEGQSWLPPLVARVKYRPSAAARAWRFWVPLALIWLLLAPLVIVIGLPVLVIGFGVALFLGWPEEFVLAVIRLYGVLCATRGLDLELRFAGVQWWVRVD